MHPCDVSWLGNADVYAALIIITSLASSGESHGVRPTTRSSARERLEHEPGARRPRPEHNQPVDAMNAGGFRHYSNRFPPRCFPGRRTGRFFRPYGTSTAVTFSSVPERGETPEYPEWVWMVMVQGAGNEMVTCVENASYRVVIRSDANAWCEAWSIKNSNQGFREFGLRRVWNNIKGGSAAPTGLMDAPSRLPRVPLADLLCRVKAVELNAFINVNTQVHTGFRLGVGGTSALTPARPP